MTDNTQHPVSDALAERVRQMGIANALAILSDLAMNHPQGLLAVVAADLQPQQRWDELKRRAGGWPVRVDDVLHQLGLSGCPEPEAKWIGWLWNGASCKTLDRIAGPLAETMMDYADPAAATYNVECRQG